MSLPGDQEPLLPRGRRGRGRGRRELPDRRWRLRPERDRRRQRLALTLGAMLLLAVLAIPLYGYIRNFVSPPRALAARVNDTTFTMGDLVKRIRSLQAEGRFTGETLNMGVVPFEVLFGMVDNEIIRQAAPRYGITVTDEEIEATLRARFYPSPPEGQAAEPEQLEREYQERLRLTLNVRQLSRSEYLEQIKAEIYRSKMREEIGKRVPTVAEQVELSWIRMPNSQDADEVYEQLQQGEVFGRAAQQVNNERVYADEKGYVGWVPRGAFPELEEVLFSLEPGQLSEPLSTSAGKYILQVHDEPQVRQVSEEMLRVLKENALEEWVNEERQQNDVEIVFDSQWYAWVVDQIRLSAPRVTPQGST
ncbi:MAG: peptidylprolyl isomerase [Dehalococcoidia bacterium]